MVGNMPAYLSGVVHGMFIGAFLVASHCAIISRMQLKKKKAAATKEAVPETVIPPAPVLMDQLDRHTVVKVNQLLQKRPGAFVSGVVVLSPERDNERVVVELSAVRSLTNDEFWDLMHPKQNYPSSVSNKQ